MELVIEAAPGKAIDDEAVEIVERKGLGHPDSIADALAEEFSQALCRYYLQTAGSILHHNVDKTLLAAGASEPGFGGGRVLEPVRIFLAGRAVIDIDGAPVPIDEIAHEVVTGWLRANLHAFASERHAAVSTLIHPGSVELAGLFGEREGRARPLANDSSCGVGYAPLGELERLVLAVEQRLNSPATRRSDPALGEDVKVMAVRREGTAHLIIACAMIDGALGSIGDYVRATERVAEIAADVARTTSPLSMTVAVNTADDIESERIYLTVTGTSAEAGDDGQTGRGNRVNGLITPGRPMTMESVAGKNPVTHVGKLYNIAAGLIAERLVADIDGVLTAECRLVSAIGRPIDEPEITNIRIGGDLDRRDPSLRERLEAVAREELGRLDDLPARLLSGELRLDRWPLVTR